jgi:hypothetical protein
MPSMILCWLFGHQDVQDFARKPRMLWGFTRHVPVTCQRCGRFGWKVQEG